MKHHLNSMRVSSLLCLVVRSLIRIVRRGANLAQLPAGRGESHCGNMLRPFCANRSARQPARLLKLTNLPYHALSPVTPLRSFYNPARRTRIIYIESKAEGLNGPARIGRVTFNRTGRTLYCKDQSFQTSREAASSQTILKRKPGMTRPPLPEKRLMVDVDDDVREEYWMEIRKKNQS